MEAGEDLVIDLHATGVEAVANVAF
jgi:hypothetical protein